MGNRKSLGLELVEEFRNSFVGEADPIRSRLAMRLVEDEEIGILLEERLQGLGMSATVSQTLICVPRFSERRSEGAQEKLRARSGHQSELSLIEDSVNRLLKSRGDGA